MTPRMLSSTLAAVLGVGSTTALAAEPTQTPTATTTTEAQAPDTLMGRSGTIGATGFWLGASFASTSIHGRLAQAPGLRGGVTFHRKFSVGMTVEAMAGSDFEAKEDQIKDLGFSSGLLLQYVLGSTRLLHGTFDAILGNGGYCVAGPADDCDWNRFVYVEPSVNLELNLHKHIRLATGVGYRRSIVDSIDGTGGIGSNDLSGLVLRSGLTVGFF